jgi:hypothetical protein
MAPFCTDAWAQAVPARPGESYADFTADGAWCWFSDPRAIFLHGQHKGLLSGWVKKDGTVEAALMDPATGKITSQVLYPQLEVDDHDNPAFVELPDKQPMVFYTKHGKVDLFWHQPAQSADQLFEEAQPMNLINAEELSKFPLRQITYANPYVLKKENNRLYCFGRWTGYKPNLMWSDNQGATFTQSKVYISTSPFDPNNRPYVKYFSDGRSKIHIVFTDGHPRVEPTNSVYYACYEKGAFWRADGTKICTIDELPFAPADASVIYQATAESGRAWIYDIAADKKGRPVIAYARYPSETDHRYRYAHYDGEKWIDYEVCQAGKWFPQTPEGQEEREQNYSAGMTLHPQQPRVLYLSRTIDGVFEIERRETADGGKTWAVMPITRGSKHDQVRPYIPRNMKKGDPTVLLWMENERYVHYTDYQSRIKYWVEE